MKTAQKPRNVFEMREKYTPFIRNVLDENPLGDMHLQSKPPLFP